MMLKRKLKKRIFKKSNGSIYINRKQEQEEKELAKSMLTKKNRYILNKMEFGENRKKEAADKLK